MATDRYEEWKELGRPEGSYAAWMASQEAPSPAAPGAPQPATPAAPATPSSGGGFQWTPDSSAAQKALAHAGGPGKVGLPPNANQAQIDAWFKEAVESGSYLQNGEDSSSTAYTKSGYSKSGGADITGMRAYAKAHGMSEDFDRWDEGQLMAWEKAKDPNCPPNTPYQAFDGSGCIEKPIDSNKGGPGVDENGKPSSGKGGGPYTPPPPPKPVTFGSQLSMGTGNPMQDMLIQQFNTGQDPTTMQNNIFGLGEDARVGGAGRNADQGNVAPTRQAQSLGGGGLWWGQDKDTFSGFDASQKNAEGAATVSPAARAVTPPVTPAAPAAPAPTIGGAGPIGGMHQGGPARKKIWAPQTARPVTPVSGMMTNAFRPSYR